MKWIKLSLYILGGGILLLLLLTYHPYKTFLIFAVAIFIALLALYEYLKSKKIHSELTELSDWVQKLLADNKTYNVDFEDDLVSKIKHKIAMLSSRLDDHRTFEKYERERLESLIGDIAHQLRTPLTNLKLSTSSTENDLIDKKSLKIQIDKLEWLVEALVKLSKIESGCISLTMKESDFNQTVLDAIGMVYIKARKKDISIEYKPKEVIVSHDTKWTCEAIYNVLDNAVKYSTEGSVVKLNLARGEMYTKLTVEDMGIGIHSDEINKIFKRFYRSQETITYDGVGIGLYLSQEIMTRQKGYIYAKSNHQGSSFEINIRN